MEKDIAIKLENVSKYYKIYNRARDRVKEAFSPTRKRYSKDFCAIKDVSLEIKKGEVLGLFGLNGAGKSTLVKMIAGVVTPTTGRIHVNGHINAMLEISGALNPELTGRQNIKFNLDLNGVEESDRSRVTKEIIDFAEIGEHIDQPVKNYSSGMGARLGFGIATSTKPEILIVDEVLAVGDTIFQSKCFMKIRSLLKGGTTVVFVSHNVDLMKEFCSRAILLHDRKVMMDGDVRDIVNIYQKVMFSSNQTEALIKIQQQKELLSSGEKLDVFDNNFDNAELYENEFIKINNNMIVDADNKDTSILETASNYSFVFDLEFKIPLKKVSISFELYDITTKLVNTLSRYKNSNEIVGVRENDKYRINNFFNNNLFYGEYSAKIIIEAVDMLDKTIDISVSDFKKMFKSIAPSFGEGSLSFEKIS
jgi:lipopolysaccharide transport system ATP-binding protein